MKLDKFIELFDKIYAITLLTKDGFYWDDLDGCVFIPSKDKQTSTRRLLCITTQNRNFLFVYHDGFLGPRFTIFPYFEKVKLGRGAKKEDVFSYIETPKKAVQHSEYLTQYYSDEVEGNNFVSRPTLEYIFKSGFAETMTFRKYSILDLYRNYEGICEGASIGNCKAINSAMFSLEIVDSEPRELNYDVDKLTLRKN